MVVDPRDSELSLVYTCHDCGGRFGADDRALGTDGEGRVVCPRCGGELTQRHHV